MAFFRDVLNPWRIIKMLFLVFLILGIISTIYFFTGEVDSTENTVFGVTFSQKFAEEMRLDWKGVYLAMLDDLGIRKMRLVAYWEKVEPEENNYYFEDLDWQIREAEKRGVEIVLAIGRRLPRWPECHSPKWAESLTEDQQREKILEVIRRVVDRYKNTRAVKVWQIENEPFLKSFGICPPFDEGFLDMEIALARLTDPQKRPIMLTASGELSSWIEPAFKADILGTSLYRTIWNEMIGHFTYPIPSVFYHKRTQMVKWVTGIDKIFISELQAEPWGPKMIWETPIEGQNKSMTLADFKEVLEYTKKTGFDEVYLWGVEWWYRRKIDGDDSFWKVAEELF